MQIVLHIICDLQNYMKAYWGIILNSSRPGGNKGHIYLNKCADFI